MHNIPRTAEMKQLQELQMVSICINVAVCVHTFFGCSENSFSNLSTICFRRPTSNCLKVCMNGIDMIEAFKTWIKKLDSQIKE